MRDGRHQVELWISRVRKVIFVTSAVFGAIFLYLTLYALPYSAILNSTDSEELIRVAAIVVFLCWIFGNQFDLNIEEKTFAHPSFEGQVRSKDYAVLAMIIVVVATMYSTIGDIHQFSIAYSVFIILNIAGWRYLLTVLPEAFTKSRDHFLREKDGYGLLMLEYLREHIYGRWQVRRFIVMCAILLLFDADVWIKPVNHYLAQAVQPRFPSISTSALASKMAAIIFACLVAIEESWMWSKRFEIHVRKSTLGDLSSSDYRLSRPSKIKAVAAAAEPRIV